RLAEILAQALFHAPPAHETDNGNDVVAERIGLDERLADAHFDFVVVPTHRRARGDHRADRGAPDRVKRQTSFAQRADYADMRVAAGAAARQHKADGFACDHA